MASAVLSVGSPPNDENPSLNFEDYFDEGFAFTALLFGVGERAFTQTATGSRLL